MSSRSGVGARKGVAPRKPAVERKMAESSMMSGEEGSEFALPETLNIVPEDQLRLTAKEMDEDVTRVMTGNNPQVPSNVVSYNFVEKEFKGVPGAADEHITVHLHIAGGVLHQDSEEGAEQRAWERNYRALVEERRREKMRVAQEEGKELSELDLEDDLQRNQFNYTERAAQTYNPVSRTRVVCTEPPKTSEASGSMSQWQIYDAYVAEQERLTAAANAEKAGAGGKGSSSAPVTNESLSRAVANAMASFATGSHGKPSLEDPMHSPQMNHALQIMERLVNQNGEDEVYSDFKFWEDASDAFRDNLGTCLPLWRFEDARTRKKQVTAIAWNTGHHDLFAVGYGSYDMLRQGSGLVHVYSLKNVGHPEYSLSTDSGVMCLDFHPHHHALLAVGCYDGTVRIHDVRKRDNKPIFASDIKSGKHSDPVWDIRWAQEPRGGGGSGAGGAAPEDAAALAAGGDSGGSSRDLTFYSVSSDGQVANWLVTKSELKMETVMTLKLVSSAAGGAGKAAPASAPGSAPDPVAVAAAGLASGAAAGTTPLGGAAASMSLSVGAGGLAAAAAAGAGGAGSATEEEGRLTGLAAGSCFAFNPFNESIFLVGTEEGRIHKCSLDYSGQYLATYEGHNMAVYSVRWNAFHPRVFLSASADWTVRMWDDSTMTPIMTFDLGTSVGDVAWAPFSSTVFAAVTDEGKVNVYDLHASKHEQMCEQKIVKKAKCTHVVFSSRSPMLLVGDSGGGVTSLKLSPNLRKITPIPTLAAKKGEAALEPPSREEVEIRKMDRLLALSDAKITIVTPIPGQDKRKGKGGAGAGAGSDAAAAADGAAAAAAGAGAAAEPAE